MAVCGEGLSILDTNLTICWVNRTMEEWYAHRRCVIGEKCFEVYHNRTSPCKECPSLEAMASRKPLSTTVYYEDTDTRLGEQELSVFPVYNGNSEISAVIEHVHITQLGDSGFRGTNAAKLYCSQIQYLLFRIVMPLMRKLAPGKQDPEKRMLFSRVEDKLQELFLAIETLSDYGTAENDLFSCKNDEYPDTGDGSFPNVSALPLRMPLTLREQEVADKVQEGLTSKQIAHQLNVSQKAVDYHRLNIRKKLKLTERQTSLFAFLNSVSL